MCFCLVSGGMNFIASACVIAILVRISGQGVEFESMYVPRYVYLYVSCSLCVVSAIWKLRWLLVVLR